MAVSIVIVLIAFTAVTHEIVSLTGESIPVMKTPLSVSEETYNAELQRRHTLFCGTQVIQAKGGGPDGKGAIAVVTCTGDLKRKNNMFYIQLKSGTDSGLFCHAILFFKLQDMNKISV